MNAFKLISSITGIVITIGSAYAAQKKISCLLEDGVSDVGKDNSSHLGAKAMTVFAVSILVGGMVNHIINRTY